MFNDNFVSGAPVDGRAIMDGAGWTVSTGGSKAEGATMTPAPDPLTGVAQVMGQTAQSVAGSPFVLVGGALLLVLLLKKKKS